MASTFLSLHYHIVFSTKDRAKTIDPDWMPRLHDYLGGSIRGHGASSQGVGGTCDHVHLLLKLKAAHRLSDVMRDIKKGSSKWVHETIGQRGFAWQEGYGAFTVSPTAVESVQAYIVNQQAHHHNQSFREELVELLRRAHVEFDDRHLD